jgi:hypothetical protein
MAEKELCKATAVWKSSENKQDHKLVCAKVKGHQPEDIHNDHGFAWDEAVIPTTHLVASQ